MKGDLIEFESRNAVGRASVAVIVILVIGGAVAVGAVVESNNHSSTTTTYSSVQVVVRVIDANGNPVTNATLRIGQELLLSVSVPNSTLPVSLHQVFRGHTYGELSWNVASTHYTYVIDSGPADVSDLGVDQVYALVTFADGSVARSNNVTMTVTN